MKNKKLLIIFAVILLFSICLAATACNTQEFTVSFDASVEGVTIPEQKVKSGKKAVKPADPENAGYKFGGWYVVGSGSDKEFDFKNDKITSDIKLEAKWTTDGGEVDFTVTYDYQGGNGDDLTCVVTLGDDFTFIVPDEREGYDFIGWFSLENGNGRIYTNYDGVGIGNWKVTSDVTAYAYWFPSGGEPYGYSAGKKKATDLTAYSIKENKEVKLSDYWGVKPVFLNLWSTRGGAG